MPKRRFDMRSIKITSTLKCILSIKGILSHQIKDQLPRRMLKSLNVREFSQIHCERIRVHQLKHAYIQRYALRSKQLYVQYTWTDNFPFSQIDDILIQLIQSYRLNQIGTYFSINARKTLLT
ncbi:hypothetical protein pb186bvf_020499 [Paramecium bursaria]